jgi:DedD protein
VKERLTGAIILVAVIVLLVPELLTGPVRSSTAPQTAATSSEEPPLRSYTINLADDSRTARSAASVSGATAQDSSGQPAPQANPSAVTDGGPSDSAEPAASSGAPSGGSGTASGGAGTTTPSSPGTATSSGTAGIAAPGEAASAPPQQRHSAAPHPVTQTHSTAPAHTTTAPKASSERAVPESGAGRGSGWMVQLGVFASRDNADRLAQELKEKGFRISVSEVAGSGGRKLFRVRAGPVTDRTAASDLAAKLRAAGAPGSIVPRT